MFKLSYYVKLSDLWTLQKNTIWNRKEKNIYSYIL